MNRYRYTPGPWHVNAIDSKRGRIVGDETAPAGTFDKLQIGNHNCTVATVYRAKDARLVAEAPAMLDSLRELITAWNYCKANPGADILSSASWCKAFNVVSRSAGLMDTLAIAEALGEAGKDQP